MQNRLRFVDESDAAFILKLRSNPLLSKHLSATSNILEDQISWINKYKTRERSGTEYYYIYTEGDRRRGLYRLYSINKVSFTIGSWLFEPSKEFKTPMIIDLLMGDLGFLHLKKPIMLFDVRKDNKRVIRYHNIKKPLLYNEDNQNNYYLIQAKDWHLSRSNVLNLLGVSESEYDSLKNTISITWPLD